MKWGFRAALAAVLMLFGSVVQAQGTITDGAANFVRGAGAFDSSPSANLTGVGNGDYLFEFGWAFRVAGDTQETFMPVPTTQDYTGNTSTLDWSDVGARGLFSAQEVAVITDSAGPSGSVSVTLTLTNISGAPLSIDVFTVADFDVNGSAGTDTGVVGPGGNNHVQMADTTAGTAEMRGLGADAHFVRAFGAATDAFGVLADAAVTNYDNSGLPFASGDITVGFQWNTTVIDIGGSADFTVVLSGNEAAVPVELMQFSVD